MKNVVEVKKKTRETTESLIRRFSKRVQQSGVLIRAKKSRFREHDKNKRETKEDALRRQKVKGKKEYLRKIGKLDDFDKKRAKFKARRRRT